MKAMLRQSYTLEQAITCTSTRMSANTYNLYHTPYPFLLKQDSLKYEKAKFLSMFF